MKTIKQLLSVFTISLLMLFHTPSMGQASSPNSANTSSTTDNDNNNHMDWGWLGLIGLLGLLGLRKNNDRRETTTYGTGANR